MAPGGKRKTSPKQSDGDRTPRAEVDRLIDAGKLKDAVKRAKICHRDQPTAEHHRLLERAYLLRARQLVEGGMPSAAQEVAHHLITFGVTDPALAVPAAELLVAVGLADQALALHRRFGEDPDGADHLRRRVADQAILHPERASGAPAEVREGAARILEALAAVQSGDAEAARSLLKDVPRSSPFGEWKRFTLGLIAFHQRDDTQVAAAWDRLDTARAPSRIASALRLLDTADANAPIPPALEGIERHTLGAAVIQPLRSIAAMIAEDRWPEALRAIHAIRPGLRAIDPTLGQRLTSVLYDPAIKSISRLGYQDAMQATREVTRSLEPLAIDPRWNRFHALLWEGPQGSLEDAEPYWRKYLKDLDTSAAIREDERPMARAIVLRHLGLVFADEADDLAHEGLDGVIHVGPSGTRARKKAVAFLEEALKACPAYRQGFESLITLHRGWEQPEEAAAVSRRLLDAFPDDFDTLLDLASHYQDRDDPSLALDYARQARALRPLDARAANLEWAAHVSLARHHALKRRFEDARRAFEAATALRPEDARSTHFLARRIVLELKAGCEEQANALIDEARSLLVEPAPLWLAILIEARRYRLTKPRREPFEALWSEATAGKTRGETAGALASLMNSFLVTDIRYTGRDTHIRQVAAYLKRTTRLKYREEDLTAVCAFVGHVPGDRKLFEALARKGERLFPDAPQFPTFLGTWEMEKGPFRCNPTKARNWLQKALTLAEARAATDPRAATLIPKLHGFLDDLDRLSSGPLGMFGPFFGGPGTPDTAGPPPDPAGFPPEAQAILDLFERSGMRPEDLFALDDEDFEDELFGDGDEDDDFGELFTDDPGPALPAPPPPGHRPRRSPLDARKPKKKKKKR
ncbi:hypothetical protein AB1L88_13690 [Tautonia sp. JC769]|uniref:hypothetical protein n=1 Tax=Tautonia sp. JC769 TaxID=3232135 RepID=UPI0034576A8E